MAADFDLCFMPGAPGTGQRLCVHHAPAAAATAAVLYLHPLADEMNKSRRMAALQSRALATAGCAVLQLDLQGCGDSSGDFADASWEGWLDDAARGLEWLQQRHGNGLPLWLWGLRAGALLALQAAAGRAVSHPTQSRPNLLLWQPPASGKALLQQFLRLRTAAGMLGEAGEAGARAPAAEGASDAVANTPTTAAPARTGIDALRQQLQQGQHVDVAGYALAPALALGLDAATMAPPSAGARTVWIEVSTREPAALLPASRTRIDAWVAAGSAVDACAVNGPAFWQTQEIEDAPALLQATVEAVSGGVGVGVGVGVDAARSTPVGAPS